MIEKSIKEILEEKGYVDWGGRPLTIKEVHYSTSKGHSILIRELNISHNISLTGLLEEAEESVCVLTRVKKDKYYLTLYQKRDKK